MKHNFREMSIWKDAMAIVKDVYLMTSNLPKEEKFGLCSQIQRSAVSIPSNIAEGSGRESDKELLHFLNIALSSSYELETQIILLSDLYHIDIQQTLEKLHVTQKMIGGFKRSIKAQHEKVLKS